VGQPTIQYPTFQQPETRLNNFNYHDRQQIYLLNHSSAEEDDEESGEPGDDGSIYMVTNTRAEKIAHSIDDVVIQPNDFIFENPKNVRDVYRIGQEIGSGTYAKVRLCIHKSTGVQRALKIIPKNRFNPDQDEILRNEVKIHSSLDHPHIIKMHEYFKDENRYYTVLEICSGGELYELIRRTGGFFLKDEAQAKFYMRQIFLTVNYLHQKNIVHRDIKPENFMIDSSDNSLKLIDLGLSIKLPPKMKLRDRQGTPYYLAPEILNKQYDHKCDCWSCGVIMYAMLCGRPPFNANDDLEVMRLIKIGQYSMEGEIWDHVSQEGKDLVGRLLCYDPDSRITAQEALRHPWLDSKRPQGLMNLVKGASINFLKAAKPKDDLYQLSMSEKQNALANMKTFKVT